MRDFACPYGLVDALETNGSPLGKTNPPTLRARLTTVSVAKIWPGAARAQSREARFSAEPRYREEGRADRRRLSESDAVARRRRAGPVEPIRRRTAPRRHAAR